MAVYLFQTPTRILYPYDEQPGPWRFWNRVKFPRPVALLQARDGSWTEYETAVPVTVGNASQKFFIDGAPNTDARQDPSGKGFTRGGNTPFTGQTNPTWAEMGFDYPLRVYWGGHVYYVNDAYRAELLAAVTTQEPTGYGAYLTLVSPTTHVTNDEIYLSGRTSEYDQGHH